MIPRPNPAYNFIYESRPRSVTKFTTLTMETMRTLPDRTNLPAGDGMEIWDLGPGCRGGGGVTSMAQSTLFSTSQCSRPSAVHHFMLPRQSRLALSTSLCFIMFHYDLYELHDELYLLHELRINTILRFVLKSKCLAPSCDGSHLADVAELSLSHSKCIQLAQPAYAWLFCLYTNSDALVSGHERHHGSASTYTSRRLQL